MREKLKGFVVGLVMAALLTSSVAFAAGAKIDVVFNSVNLTVNGAKVAADNILYDGTTYVPLRAMAEMMGKDVGWDQATMTASINDKGAITGQITVGQVPLDIKILEPDSIGTVYMEAFYRNNTSLPVLSYQSTVLLKDKNEKTYLSSFDTVMPGEISSKFNTFGPTTRDRNDFEILQTEIRLDLDNGKYLLVEYDHKLNRYSYNEYNNY